LDSNFTHEESVFRRSETELDEEHEEDFDKGRVEDEGVDREMLVQCSGTCVKDDNHNEDPCLIKVNILLNFSFLILKYLMQLKY
jgi:hypothetical protein